MTAVAPAPSTEELLRVFYQDPVLYFRSIHPDWFPKKMPWLHRGVVALVLGRADFLCNFGEERWNDETATWTEEDLLELCKWFTYKERPDDPECPELALFEPVYDDGAIVACNMLTSRYLQVMIPRGFSKTTLFNALIVFCILYKIEEYIVYLSETATHAEQQLQNVKRELESNERILEVYGVFAPERNDSQKWTGNVIETLNGVTVQATGRGGQVRGKNVGGRRPGIILLDDVEDTDSVATVEQRAKTLKWLMGDVRPALPRRRGRIFILGTLLHSESMMMKVANDPNWITIRFGAMLSNGFAIWPAHMTEGEWLKEREIYLRQGLIAQFYMEFQSTIHVDADNRKFRVEDMKVQVMARTEFELVSMACDPAISEEAGADSFVLAVAGKTTRGHNHVLDLWGDKGVHPHIQVQKFFELHFKWLPDIHGVESIAYQRALIGMLTEQMAHEAKLHGGKAFFAIQPITHGKTAKVVRVEGILAPRYRAGYITHQRHFQALHDEALDWPNGKKDHLDAVAMAINLLNPGATLSAPEQFPQDALEGITYNVIQEEWSAQCP